MSKRDRKKLQGRISVFLRQYGRKAYPNGHDPNDRPYDRQLEKIIKQMDPQELDRLMHDDDADDQNPPQMDPGHS